MLLLVKGGSLNTLNDEGFSPLAFGSERILNLLDLRSGIATYNKKESSMKKLPAEYNNNKLLNRSDRNKNLDNIEANMKYAPMRSPSDSVRNNDKSLSQYIEPGNLEDRLNRS